MLNLVTAYTHIKNLTFQEFETTSGLKNNNNNVKEIGCNDNRLSRYFTIDISQTVFSDVYDAAEVELKIK